MKYFADFLLNACSILAATTVYSGNPVALLGLLLLPAIAACLSPPVTESTRQSAIAKVTNKKSAHVSHDDEPSALPTKPFVTHYKGAMMVVTCVCILAVDFPIFPRRFAKTESLGTSLMDLGVGSFVFAAGVVAARRHLKGEDDSAPKTPFLHQIKDSLRHSLPLLVLGFIRLYTVKGLNYAEHVTEYGVHWNFFFTLALIAPFVAILRPVLQLVPSFAVIGYAITVVQQVLFTYTGLLTWAITAERVDWLSKNREGLVSLPGYLAIFLCGLGIGSSILRRDQSPAGPESSNDQWLASMFGGEEKAERVKSSQRRWAIFTLAKWTAIWCIVYYFTTGFYGPRLVVSRRLGNMPYVVWVNAFNCGQLLLFCAIETVLFPGLYLSSKKATEQIMITRATSKVLGAFNRNGLAIFLVANLLTGLVNMSVKTIVMDHVSAMAILVAYMGTLTALGLGLDYYNVTIKL